MAEVILCRHDLIYVTPSAWRAVIADYDVDGLAGWAERGWPTIARRPACNDTEGTVPMGLPLPPQMGRLRLALRCPADAIARTSPPPLLADATKAAAADWHATIAALVRLQPAMRCFGSLAWTHQTGLNYLQQTSDLDLILHCETLTDAEGLVGGLDEIATTAPMRIDAELVTPSGKAVQWREWKTGSSTLLAKSLAGAQLLTREALFP